MEKKKLELYEGDKVFDHFRFWLGYDLSWIAISSLILFFNICETTKMTRINWANIIVFGFLFLLFFSDLIWGFIRIISSKFKNNN